ncbi:MBL fold metallo-hydrolase [Rhizobium sp. BK251]|uniref:MBL fold metallo-hydrolase n=1 Tax=Rhizobium sp. BK251 TaxID=2512125 RepID=UPI0010439991|nr:MBL fold metallo-hydrolase [Rhizobium sp. BK251]TCL73965.1 phosphoribosyl 1,2-cyclic phosphate phosphodiesterase [Rhizobium sp. BK251]
MRYLQRFTILGCSSSPGVPRITGDWGACDPTNPKNRRTRAAFMVQQTAPGGGTTTVVIDTGPDFREQVIAAKVDHVDAVLYTHAHADHIHGIDDLRGFFHNSHHRIPIHATRFTMDRIREAFRYCLETPPGSNYPPIVEANLIEELDRSFLIEGPGGPIRFMPLLQRHGDIDSLGFRIGDVAYCSDISDFPPETVEKLQGLDVLIIDALQYRPHPSHLSLEQSLGWIERLRPQNAVLTHMHTPLDYETVMAETPPHVVPAFDQMSFEREVDF